MTADSIHIEALTQTKGGGIDIMFVVLNDKGGDEGRYAMSWRTAEELDQFMQQATLQELIRTALRGIYTPATKELDTVALVGKVLDVKAPMTEKAVDAVEVKV